MFLVGVYITLQSQKLGETLVFNWVHQGRIDSSWLNLTDTCELQFAKRIFYKGQKLQNLLSSGDKVEVRFGYDGELRTEFAGYLTRYDARIPLTVFCEDNMWVLKKGTITKNFGSKAKLKDVIDTITGYYNQNYNAGLSSIVEDAELGAFSVKELSGAMILEKLKSTYGLYSYFRGNVLYSGLAYQATGGTVETRRYRFTQNIINNDLEYRIADDVKLRVKAIAFDAKNKKVIEYGGDPEGELHTMHYPIGTTKEQLKKLAEAEASRQRFDGYAGAFTAFHIPTTEHSDIVEIEDFEYPEREGRYLVDRVVKTFGVNGIRRTIYPGKKA